MAAVPLSSALGSPVFRLRCSGSTARSASRAEQWLFVAEAAPSLVLAVVTYFYLTDRPADAHGSSGRARLAGRPAAATREARFASVLRSLYDPRVLAASLIYFGVVAALYGVGFWLPSIVKGFGVSIAETGWITAIPYAVGFVGMILWGMSSDSSMERIGHLSIALALAAIGIGASAALNDPLLKMVALTIGA